MTQQAPNPSGAAPQTGADPALAERAQVLEDWVTIWQSEMAGVAVDREMQEALVRMGAAWAAQAQVANGLIGQWQRDASAERAPGPVAPGPVAPGPVAPGPAGADATARAAAADAAPDARDAVIERLLARVAELERRLGPSPGDTGGCLGSGPEGGPG